MLGAAVLDLACAASLAVVVRRGRPAVVRRPGVWSYLGGVAVGAAVVAGITSVCLGATPVGALAMQSMDMGHVAVATSPAAAAAAAFAAARRSPIHRRTSGSTMMSAGRRGRER